MAYSWKITGKKFLWSLGYIVVAGAIVWATENPLYVGLVPVFEVARNWLKHRKD